ncbi:MAG: tRNA pseudouridine(55) synthase TruB [Gammaproteobacteria bacterium]
MARRRNKGRNISGILLLDKPVGITSNLALQKVKRLFNASKAGHTGNLDPMASGLLPICLGEATKVSGYLLDSDKTYLGTIKLGERTNTADAEGEVIETRPVGNIDEAKIRQVLAHFIGEQEQVPPMHSAIKQNGQPLYKLAHQGIEVERKARKITIYKIDLLRISENELDIEVHCSKGTYIRTLAEDVGEALGCGAHLSALRRTQSGPFNMEHVISLPDLEQLAEQGTEALDRLLQPIESALTDWPTVNLSEHTAHYLRQGQAVQVPQAPSSGWVKIFADDHQFLGIGQIMSDGRVAPKRLINIG